MLQSCGDTGAGAVRVLVGAPSTRRTAGRRRIVEIPRLQVIHRTGQYCQRDIDQPPFNSDGPASSITIAKGDQLLEPMNVPSFNGWFEYDGSSGRPRQAPAQRPNDHDRVRRFRAGVRQPVHCRTRSAEVIQRELESDGRNIQPDTEMGGRWDVQGGEMLRKREGEGEDGRDGMDDEQAPGVELACVDRHGGVTAARAVADGSPHYYVSRVPSWRT